MVIRWTLYDPVINETYEMHINPNEGGTPGVNKTIGYEATSAPDGNLILFEGRDEAQKLEWSGVIIEEEHLNELVKWTKKRRQLLLRDDLEREFWIYITSFSPTRQKRVGRPWKHEYSMSAYILDYPTEV